MQKKEREKQKNMEREQMEQEKKEAEKHREETKKEAKNDKTNDGKFHILKKSRFVSWQSVSNFIFSWKNTEAVHDPLNFWWNHFVTGSDLIGATVYENVY